MLKTSWRYYIIKKTEWLIFFPVEKKCRDMKFITFKDETIPQTDNRETSERAGKAASVVIKAE